MTAADIPDDAVESAWMAVRDAILRGEVTWEQMRAALAAALPALRGHIADEIEVLENGWDSTDARTALAEAARVARGDDK